MPRTKKPFKLTNKTYYSKARPHLSQSQIKDYLKSPRLYHAKHVAKTIKREPSRLMRIGKFFDALLSDPKEAKKYYVKSRGDADDFALTEAEFEEATLKAEEVKRHPFWTTHPTKTKFQVPLEAAILEDGTFVKVEDIAGREHVLVCGLIDRLDLMPTYALISDFKSTNPQAILSPSRWYYHSLDAGYHYQFAMYRELVALHYPEYTKENIPCAHITAVIDEIPYAALFGMPQRVIDEALPDLVKAAWQIQQGWFPKDLLTWENTVLCGPS